MITPFLHTRKIVLFLALWCGLHLSAAAQGSGRVVINEYMPWTLNGCGATAEFVELLNFGPGPINIGCYLLTDGDFTVTIPANTILQPGEFYLIAGQDVIAAPCANIDSSVRADLNWNSCGCTSGPIPTTGDGFFTDGGSANEQVVLLDPSRRVVDAVIRGLPAEPSAPIAPGAPGCSGSAFDLDTMAIDYEVLGMSAGRGNSFARRLDGDCGWVKDPQQSGNATNNTPGETSSVRYDFTIVQSMDCDDTHGSIDVYVNVGTTADVFPMNYTIAFDSNRDGIFDFSDTYTYGIDSTPPRIAIQNLPLGRYRVTVSSAKGCFLQTFEFSILDCTALLGADLVYFNLLSLNNGVYTFDWVLSRTETVAEMLIEGSNGTGWVPLSQMRPEAMSGSKHFTQVVSGGPAYRAFRLTLINKDGSRVYSQTITAPDGTAKGGSPFPNPARETIAFPFQTRAAGKADYRLYNFMGTTLHRGTMEVQPGAHTLNLRLDGLSAGLYQLSLALPGAVQPIQFRFVKL